jgi:hypothetical protein
LICFFDTYNPTTADKEDYLVFHSLNNCFILCIFDGAVYPFGQYLKEFIANCAADFHTPFEN